MRLYYHPESDGLFWDDFQTDPLCEDVTDEPRFRHAARLRGLKEPEVISALIEGNPIVKKERPKSSYAEAVVQSYKTWQRKPSDFYPTPVDGTESIIPLIEAFSKVFEEMHGRPIRRIWEPACGDGRLARVLEWHGYEVVSTDINPYPGYGQGGMDFLIEDPLITDGWDIGEIDMIVTNPPFKLSVEFIRRARRMTPWVIMLVKQNYYNAGSRYDFFQGEDRPTFFLPLTWRLAFLEEERGKSPLMDCAWAAWTPEGAYYDGCCIFEPLKRIAYPGYAKRGTLASLRVLEGELDALTKAIAELRHG